MASRSGLLLLASRVVLFLSLAGAGAVLVVLFWTSVEHSVTDSTATYREIISRVDRNVDYETHLLHLGVIATSIAWTGAAAAWALRWLGGRSARPRQPHDGGFSKTNKT
jgi:hypothetical protein